MDFYTLGLIALVCLVGGVGIAALPWRDAELEESIEAFQELGRLIRRFFGS